MLIQTLLDKLVQLRLPAVTASWSSLPMAWISKARGKGGQFEAGNSSFQRTALVTKVTRTLRMARINQPRLPETEYVVTELEPGQSFTWVATRPGVTTRSTCERVTRLGVTRSGVTQRGCAGSGTAQWPLFTGSSGRSRASS